MVQCVAFNCNIRSQKGVSMYLFPKDPKFRRIWIRNLRRDGFKVTDYSKLCAKHFTPDQFTTHPALAKKCGYKKLDLRPDAIPTLFDLPIEKVEKKPRTSTAFFKRRTIEALGRSDDVSDTENVSDGNAVVNSEASASACNVESSTDLEHQSIMIQASPETREIGVQVDMVIPRHSFEDDDMDCTDSSDHSDMEDSDMEWMMPDQDSEDEGTTPKTNNDMDGDTKFIVYKSSLEYLLPTHCLHCGILINKADYEWRVLGTVVSIQSTCKKCSISWEWTSQPFSGMMPWGNLIVAAAILFSGCSPVKAINFLSFAGIRCFSYRTYNALQQLYLVPAVEQVWHQKQQELFEEIKTSGVPVKLGGDARCCSPGHTAKFGSYSIMDLNTSQVVDIQLVQSNEVQNSYHMELEGLKRCLAKLETEEIEVSHLVTDRHSQVKAYMKREQPQIVHMFDVWHVAKGVYKKLDTISKKKYCELIGPWAHSISNHIYFCAATSDGNGDLVREKWVSILNHVTDIHEGHSELYPRCLHGPVDNRPWIRRGSKAFLELELVVKGRLLLTDIKQLSHIGQTSCLEAFHKVVCSFAPKAVHFFYMQMQARLYLAALHFNENVARPQSRTKEGEQQYCVSYPKGRKGEGVAKEVKVDQTFNYISDLMAAVVTLRTVNDSYVKAREALDRLPRRLPPPLSQSTPKPPKHVTVQQHIGRFNDRH